MSQVSAPGWSGQARQGGWQKVRRMLRRSSRLGMLCAVALIAYYALFFAMPFVRAIWLAFHNWDYIVTPRYVGLRNWQRAFADPNFWLALKVTVLFSISEIAAGLSLGLLLALLLSQLRGKLQQFLLTIYYLPVITPAVVTAYLWGWLYRPYLSGGAINSVLVGLGLPEQPFLGSTQQALWCITAMVVWMNLGGVALLMLAGMSDIPPSLYEAARLDGAGFWRVFFSVTLPLLRPVVVYLIVSSVISTVQMFEPFFLLPGPSNSTRTVGLFTYQLGFQSMNLGYGAALSLVIFVILLGATVAQLQRFRAAFEH